MILPGMVYPTYPRIDKKVCDGYHVEARRKLQLEDGEQCMSSKLVGPQGCFS